MMAMVTALAAIACVMNVLVPCGISVQAAQPGMESYSQGSLAFAWSSARLGTLARLMFALANLPRWIMYFRF